MDPSRTHLHKRTGRAGVANGSVLWLWARSDARRRRAPYSSRGHAGVRTPIRSDFLLQAHHYSVGRDPAYEVHLDCVWGGVSLASRGLLRHTRQARISRCDHVCGLLSGLDSRRTTDCGRGESTHRECSALLLEGEAAWKVQKLGRGTPPRSLNHAGNLRCHVRTFALAAAAATSAFRRGHRPP